MDKWSFDIFNGVFCFSLTTVGVFNCGNLFPFVILFLLNPFEYFGTSEARWTLLGLFYLAQLKLLANTLHVNLKMSCMYICKAKIIGEHLRKMWRCVLNSNFSGGERTVDFHLLSFLFLFPSVHWFPILLLSLGRPMIHLGYFCFL